MVKAFTLLQMELKEKFRYKIEIFSASTDAILLIFPSIAILLFGNLEISGIQSKTEYIQYMLFSLILWQFVENMWSAVFEIRRKLKEGNFEYMMNMPLKGMHYVFGWAVSGVVSIVFEMVSGSAILPCPTNPLANSPLSAGMIKCPKSSANSRFCFVEGC